MHTCIATLVIAGIAGTSLAHHPRIVNIGVPTGALSSRAVAVSRDGAVVIGQSESVAFRWTETTGIEVLPTLPGIPTAYGAAITPAGETIAGYNRFVHQIWQCGNALLWTDTGIVNLGSHIPDLGSSATVISPDGRYIAGYTWDCAWPYRTRGFLWDSSGSLLTTILHPTSSTGSIIPRAMSADGQTIAIAGVWGNDFSQPLLWTESGGAVVLPRPQGMNECSIHWMSHDGMTIAGDCLNMGTGEIRPILWIDREPFPYAHVPTATHTSIRAMTEDVSFAVGRATSGALSTAIAWIDAVPVDLSDHLLARGVDLSGWQLQQAMGMTPDGTVIIGAGHYHGELRAFVVFLPCYANCTGATEEPILSVDDFTCFIDRFAAAQSLTYEEQITHYANCDRSTSPPVLNVDDFTCFINAFAQGCQ